MMLCIDSIVAEVAAVDNFLTNRPAMRIARGGAGEGAGMAFIRLHSGRVRT